MCKTTTKNKFVLTDIKSTATLASVYSFMSQHVNVLSLMHHRIFPKGKGAQCYMGWVGKGLVILPAPFLHLLSHWNGPN